MAGDPQLASLIALDAGRPHLLLDATPERTPWLTMAKFNETGGVVVWRASDTVGTPPPDIAQRFPGLVPEVPRAFEWLVNGRQPLLRIGWAIVRPKGAVAIASMRVMAWSAVRRASTTIRGRSRTAAHRFE